MKPVHTNTKWLPETTQLISVKFPSCLEKIGKEITEPKGSVVLTPPFPYFYKFSFPLKIKYSVIKRPCLCQKEQ